ncbi:MAG: NifU family protein [Candidatus Ratteibacteria bacterium]|nr:NifU family protein [Candidatus Ratteibacteria bacterium]
MKEKVEGALEDVRKVLQAEGGDCEVVDVDEKGKVSVRLQGSCKGCPFSTFTLKMRIETIIKEKVPEVTEVVAVE